MPQYDPNKYDTVDDRLTKFWSEYPDGMIKTELLSDPNNLEEVVFVATLWPRRTTDENGDCFAVSSGHASEKRGTSFKDGANVTSHVENAETSAIGRALANWKFKAKKDSPRPSREEMAKTQKQIPDQDGHHQRLVEDAKNKLITAIEATGVPVSDSVLLNATHKVFGRKVPLDQIPDVDLRRVDLLIEIHPLKPKKAEETETCLTGSL